MQFRAPFPPSKIASARRKKFCASFSLTPGGPIASASPARREQGRARWWTAWRATIAPKRKPSASSPWIPRALSQEARFSAIAIRMQGHATDAGVFIRSMATRGFLGGLSQATRDTTLLLDAAGKQIILVETVGVGQGEIEIVRLADCTIVVLMPGMGDDVQSLKAGLMEIGDIFVLNKSDREGADRFEQQLKGILQLVPERDGWKPPVVRTIATENKGVAELGRQIELFRKHFEQAHERQAREIAHWKEWILQLLETRLMERVAGKYLGEKELDAIAAAVAERKTDPYAAVNEILARAGLGETR